MFVPVSKRPFVRFFIATSLAALVLSACSRPGAAPAAAQRTATLANGSLTATVSATGNIQPESDVHLSFQAAGTVSEVAVKVGDRVKKGDLIAKLDGVDLELAVTQANGSLAQANGSLEQAKASLEQANNTLGNSDTAIAQANNQILIATAAYSKTVSGVRSADVVAAKAAYDAAIASQAKTMAGPAAEDTAAAEGALRNPEAALRQAQAAYDAIFSRKPAGIGATPQSLQLEQATNSYNTAKANFDKASKAPDAAQLSAANQQVENARASLDRTRTPVLSYDIAQARANIDQAGLGLKNAQAQKISAQTQVKAADLQVKQAELALNQAAIGVKQAQRRLSQALLSAPIDGVVSAVGVDAGETAAGTPFTLVDDSVYHIDITVDEIDIAKIKLGQEVAVTLDSLPGIEVKGKVDRINPTSTTVNGVVSYSVRVTVEANKEAALRAGMTANAAIVLDKRDNVLLAPNWAVRREKNTGKAFLTMKDGEKTKEIEIKLGLRNDASSEIVSGANAGDIVLAPTTPSAFGG